VTALTIWSRRRSEAAPVTAQAVEQADFPGAVLNPAELHAERAGNRLAGAEGVRRGNVDDQLTREGPDSFGHPVDQGAAPGEGAVQIEHQVLQVQRIESGDVDGNHADATLRPTRGRLRGRSVEGTGAPDSVWRARQDSNLRPSAPEADALSAELQARVRDHTGPARIQRRLPAITLYPALARNVDRLSQR
jgi:hypothetical protein